MSRLKQIGNAVSLYAADNEEKLPSIYSFDPDPKSGERFIQAVSGYSKYPNSSKEFTCTEDKADVHQTRLAQVEGSGPLGFEHDLELRSSYRPHTKTIDLQQIEDPQSRIYLRDPIRSVAVERGRTVMNSPHGEAFVILFLDNHVRALHLGPNGFYKPNPK
ncbi:MAG: hypothetical protein WCK51_01695 [Armatimonadota bacterium]